MPELRKRNVGRKGDTKDEHSIRKVEKEEEKEEKTVQIEKGTFWLTRIVILRFLAFIYFVAFLVAFNQNVPLLGGSGLLPVPLFMDRVLRHTGGSRLAAAQLVPSIFWLFDYHTHADALLSVTALAGLCLSGLVLVLGSANMPIMFMLWTLYHSLVNVGQRWYSFGWESQLLESGFLGIFLCPLLSLRRMPKRTPTSFVVLMGYRWLIFRIMLGAGLIKIRGDQCWRDFTCMHYHYQTQPVPGPMAYFMHQEPDQMHRLEVLVNHFTELVAPWLLLLVRPLVMVGGAVQIFFQGGIIVSGNYSFLNWLTILPCLACYDDRALRRFFGEKARREAMEAETASRTSEPTRSSRVRRTVNVSLGLLISVLSIPVVQNLLSTEQMMNTSFDRLQIVNTYGAFGSITKERTEIILQGTRDDPRDPNVRWREYEFKCKPGSLTRRPCVISPYHYRLDWLMWFAAFQDYQQNEWLVHLTAKLLANDEGATSLIAHNPFLGGPPPRFIRAEHFRYNFTTIGGVDAKQGMWWRRERVGTYLPPVDLNTLRDYLKQFGWPIPRP